MQAIRQYAEVKNGYLHVKLPADFIEQHVEIIILPVEKITPFSEKTFSQEEALMQLAGTWTIAEFEAFNQATSFFNQIDEELWS